MTKLVENKVGKYLKLTEKQLEKLYPIPRILVEATLHPGKFMHYTMTKAEDD